MDAFIQWITRVNDAINGAVWGWPALILLGFVGVLMTCLTKFFQVTHIGHWMKNTIGAIFKDKHVTGHTTDKSIPSSSPSVPPWLPRWEPAISWAWPAPSPQADRVPYSGCGSSPSSA